MEGIPRAGSWKYRKTAGKPNPAGLTSSLTRPHIHGYNKESRAF